MTRWATPLTRSPGDTVAGFVRRATGELLVYGSSYQALAGGGGGGADLFVAGLASSNGELQWIRQFGSPSTDWASAIAAHAGLIYAVSETFVDEPPAWHVNVTTLTEEGQVLGQSILAEAGAGSATAVGIVGGQLVIVGAVPNGDGALHGWLGFGPLGAGG